MGDEMLTELYRLAFQTKAEAERLSVNGGTATDDRMRQVAIAQNKMLAQLIDFRTAMLWRGQS
jgi:hypothetical protein